MTTAANPLTISVVIATAFRERTLRTTLESVAAQTRRPTEVVIVDGAPAPGVESLTASLGRELDLPVVYRRTAPPSAALQRNLGVSVAAGDIVLFLDDDGYPEPDCFEKMLDILDGDTEGRVGGVGVLIRNQLCPPPSPKAKRWLDFLADEPLPSYSGKVLGPAIAVGTEPSALHDVVQVDWLNSGCTAYRKKALPDEGFNRRFFGYSYMEDVDLSLRVARHHALVVHRGAFMYHDSQPSRFKAPYARARMVVQNRYYVMTVTLGRTSVGHHSTFLASIVVPLLVSIRSIRSGRDAADWFLTLGGTLAGLIAFSEVSRR
ncbi:MAG: glycosyltransferase [Vicinamibacterales bacterium]